MALFLVDVIPPSVNLDGAPTPKVVESLRHGMRGGLNVRASILILCGLALLLLTESRLCGATEPELWQPGRGGNPADINREVLWIDVPDFDAMCGGSEVIGEFNLESEIANDFLLESDATIRKITWWGAYWNFTDPDQYPTGSGFNLRFYHNADCVPDVAPFIEYLLPGNDCAEALAEGGDQLCDHVYEYCPELPLAPGHYWFSVQMADHEFPPQWGRQGADIPPIQLCDSVFRSVYFSYPDWHVDPFIWYDASQMFEDECEATAIEKTSWGAVKNLYR